MVGYLPAPCFGLKWTARRGVGRREKGKMDCTVELLRQGDQTKIGNVKMFDMW
jgi:hypothetical protein